MRIITSGGSSGSGGFPTAVLSLSQAGVAAPTAVVQDNTIGVVPSYGYSSSGLYTITMTGAFTVGKTAAFAYDMTDIISIVVTDVNTVTINTNANGVLTNRQIVIIQY